MRKFDIINFKEVALIYDDPHPKPIPADRQDIDHPSFLKEGKGYALRVGLLEQKTPTPLTGTRSDSSPKKPSRSQQNATNENKLNLIF